MLSADRKSNRPLMVSLAMELLSRNIRRVPSNSSSLERAEYARRDRDLFWYLVRGSIWETWTRSVSETIKHVHIPKLTSSPDQSWKPSPTALSAFLSSTSSVVYSRTGCRSLTSITTVRPSNYFSVDLFTDVSSTRYCFVACYLCCSLFFSLTVDLSVSVLVCGCVFFTSLCSLFLFLCFCLRIEVMGIYPHYVY